MVRSTFAWLVLGLVLWPLCAAAQQRAATSAAPSAAVIVAERLRGQASLSPTIVVYAPPTRAYSWEAPPGPAEACFAMYRDRVPLWCWGYWPGRCWAAPWASGWVPTAWYVAW